MKEVFIDFNLSVSDGANTSFTTIGTYEIKDDIINICFVEETDLKANTSLYIYQDRIKIKRSGPLMMESEFIMEEATTIKITADFGYQLAMNNYTNYLEINENSIQIIYQTEMDKEQKLTHNLTIKWSDVN